MRKFAFLTKLLTWLCLLSLLTGVVYAEGSTPAPNGEKESTLDDMVQYAAQLWKNQKIVGMKYGVFTNLFTTKYPELGNNFNDESEYIYLWDKRTDGGNPLWAGKRESDANGDVVKPILDCSITTDNDGGGGLPSNEGWILDLDVRKLLDTVKGRIGLFMMPKGDTRFREVTMEKICKINVTGDSICIYISNNGAEKDEIVYWAGEFCREECEGKTVVFDLLDESLRKEDTNDDGRREDNTNPAQDLGYVYSLGETGKTDKTISDTEEENSFENDVQPDNGVTTDDKPADGGGEKVPEDPAPSQEEEVDHEPDFILTINEDEYIRKNDDGKYVIKGSIKSNKGRWTAKSKEKIAIMLEDEKVAHTELLSDDNEVYLFEVTIDEQKVLDTGKLMIAAVYEKNKGNAIEREISIFPIHEVTVPACAPIIYDGQKHTIDTKEWSFEKIYRVTDTPEETPQKSDNPLCMNKSEYSGEDAFADCGEHSVLVRATCEHNCEMLYLDKQRNEIIPNDDGYLNLALKIEPMKLAITATASDDCSHGGNHVYDGKEHALKANYTVNIENSDVSWEALTGKKPDDYPVERSVKNAGVYLLSCEELQEDLAKLGNNVVINNGDGIPNCEVKIKKKRVTLDFAEVGLRTYSQRNIEDALDEHLKQVGVLDTDLNTMISFAGANDAAYAPGVYTQLVGTDSLLRNYELLGEAKLVVHKESIEQTAPVWDKRTATSEYVSSYNNGVAIKINESSQKDELEYNEKQQKPSLDIKGIEEEKLIFEYWQGDTKLEDVPTDAGNYELVVRAKEGLGYTGEVRAPFEIKPFALSKLNLTGVFANDEIFKSDDVKMVNSIDEIKQMKFKVNLGTYVPLQEKDLARNDPSKGENRKYTLTVQGRGNYSGSVTFTFELKQKDLSQPNVLQSDWEQKDGKFVIGDENEVYSISFTYVGNGNKDKMVYGTDYTIEPGTGYFTIKAVADGDYSRNVLFEYVLVTPTPTPATPTITPPTKPTDTPTPETPVVESPSSEAAPKLEEISDADKAEAEVAEDKTETDKIDPAETDSVKADDTKLPFTQTAAFWGIVTLLCAALGAISYVMSRRYKKRAVNERAMRLDKTTRKSDRTIREDE